MTSQGSKQLESSYSYDSGKRLAQDVVVLTMLKLRADAVTPSASSEGLDAYFVARGLSFFRRYHAPSTQPRSGSAEAGMFPTTPDINKKTTRTGVSP